MLSVVSEAFLTPVTSLLICILLWISVKVWFGIYEARNYSVCYFDIVERKQIYRLFTAPFFHSYPHHLLFNIITLWSCRKLESVFGIYFFLQGTLLFLCCDSIFSLLLLHVINKLAVEGHPLANANLSGFSGILLAWICFTALSVSFSPESIGSQLGSFNYLGIFAVPWFVAHLVMIVTLSIILPRENGISNISGFFCGICLSLGMLTLTNYWNVSLLFDTVLFIGCALFGSTGPNSGNSNSNSNSSNSRQRNLNGSIVLSVMEFPMNDDSDSNGNNNDTYGSNTGNRIHSSYDVEDDIESNVVVLNSGDNSRNNNNNNRNTAEEEGERKDNDLFYS